MPWPLTIRKRGQPSEAEDRKPFTRVPLWLRALAALPLPVWYRISGLLAWLAEYVFRHRRGIVDSQLRRCFPDKDEAWIGETRRSFYRNCGNVICEILKEVSITENEIRRRVRFANVDAARAELDAGRSVLLVTSHNCNWEWTLLALSIGMGHPVDVAYKPLKNHWGDRLFLTIRIRFGARMVSAGRLLRRVLRHRGEARIVAIAADQNPDASSVRHVTQFFDQDTAFYLGPDAIARAARLSVYYMAMRRESRGYYSVTFEPLAAAGENLARGEIIDRYARRVEALTREHPEDWLWTYRRWKMHGAPAKGDQVASLDESSGAG